MLVGGSGMETGGFFAGECVEITADAFDSLRNLPGRALVGALENQVFDEMRHTVELRRFAAGAGAQPQANADAGHVRHFSRCHGEAVLEMANLVQDGR